MKREQDSPEPLAAHFRRMRQLMSLLDDFFPVDTHLKTQLTILRAHQIRSEHKLTIFDRRTVKPSLQVFTGSACIAARMPIALRYGLYRRRRRDAVFT